MLGRMKVLEPVKVWSSENTVSSASQCSSKKRTRVSHAAWRSVLAEAGGKSFQPRTVRYRWMASMPVTPTGAA